MARKKRKRIASRGSVNNIILRTLVNGDKYGYEIIKEVEEYSNGKIVLKQPSLYSSLTRFEEKKYVSSYWGDSDIGGRRHYYHLTPEGMEYYKRFVLKESNDEDNKENIQQILEDNNINLSTASTSSDNISYMDNEEIDNSSLNEDDSENEEFEDNSEDSNYMIVNEVGKDEIPEIANFDNNSTTSDNIIIADHQFHTATPIENMIINYSDNTTPQHPTPQTEEVTTNTQQIEESIEEDNTQSYEQLFNNLRDNTKLSNKKYIEHNPKKLYIRKPKKTKKIILDIDGIYKLRDEDYVPEKRQPEIIIDNVIKRTTHTRDLIGYASYTSTSTKDKAKVNAPVKELTEEEKRQKNENFVAKFNLLTMSKMKPVTAPVPKPEPKIVEKKPEPKIDYRVKLNAIIESNNVFISDDDLEEDTPQNQNNMFNYVDEDKWNTQPQSTPQQNEQQPNIVDNQVEEDDVFINLDEEETFETKSNNSEYIEEINTYTAPPTPVKMTRYDNITQAVLVDKIYLLNNKLKMVFGIIMSLIMVFEVTALMLIFRNLELIQQSDKTLFVVAYVLIGIFALIYLLPYFMNSNSHKANNFKLKYSIWFGILTFLVCSILIYCFNALSGFEIDNFRYFAVKLILPMTLAFNFIIGPLVYSLLIKNKSFYD